MTQKETSFSIKNWSEDDRPREKLQLKGRAALSDAELIAILIGSGNQDESAVALSKRILAVVENNLTQLGTCDMADLTKFKGIGEAKAVSIIAALELGRRRAGAQALERYAITSSKTVFQLMEPVLGDLDHEEFWIIYVNNANKVIQKMQLSKGGITGTIVDNRLVLKTALSIGAVGMVLVHNHPSGSLKPSVADKQITEKLKLAAASLDIQILDHIIVTQKAYFSFADEQIL